jgi:hypothetical protein
MADLSYYLLKFKTLLRSSEYEREAAFDVLSRMKLCEKKEELELKRGVLYVKTSAIAKNELYIQKKNVLEILRREGVRITDLK